MKKIVEMYDSVSQTYAKDMIDEMGKDIYSVFIPRFVSSCPSKGPIFDAGCGSGDCLALISKQYPEIPLIGSDASEKMLEIAQSRVPSAKLIHNGLNPPLNEKIRGILCYFVIHHLNLDELRIVLKEWHAMLNEHGRILIAFWLGETTGEKIDYPSEWNEVPGILYSFETLKVLLQSNGFQVSCVDQREEKEMGMNMGFIEAFI